jgi:glucose/arabinose dehydrogenase
VSTAVAGRSLTERGTAQLVLWLLALSVLLAVTAGSAAASSEPNPATSSAGVVSAGPIDVKLTRLAKVTRGTALAFRHRDPVMYLARQGGQVVPIDARGRVGAPVLDIGNQIGSQREQGLLGLVFSPDSRRMYVYYTSESGDVTLDEYRVSSHRRGGVTVDASSRRTLLELPHPDPHHNGGQLAFGRDHMLYVAIGDGGGHRGDGRVQVPGGNSQSLDNLYGKIVRIDPRPSGARPYSIPGDNPLAAGGGAPEIWQYGLRNPWRFSFDRATGDLWIGDVGQDHWEEVNVLPAGRSGANFGYPLLEGTHPLNAPNAPGTVAPVYELWHRSGNCAVTGGYVYRGTKIRNLEGMYVFADYCRGRIKALRQWQGRVVSFAALKCREPLISSFAEDGKGELYVVSQAKGVLRMDPR